MKRFTEWHKGKVEWWKRKLGLSDYGMMWVAFLKGLGFGVVITYFCMK